MVVVAAWANGGSELVAAPFSSLPEAIALVNSH